MKMPTIRSLWTFYKRDVLRDALRVGGITPRSHAQVPAQNAFYLGARCTLQSLATLLEEGDVEQVHDVIARHGRQLKKMRALAGPARQHPNHTEERGVGAVEGINIMRSIHSLMVVAVLSLAVVGVASADTDAAARLRAARSLRCTYQVGIGTWVRSGRRTVEEDKDNGVATYDDINLTKRTARIIANAGSADLAAWLDRQGSLWLVERTPMGYEVVTTVFPMYAEGTNDEFVVLESRHTLSGFIALAETSYGTCKVWQ
jgi:hypothetical protein